MMSIRSLAVFNGSSLGGDSDWLALATVTAQAHSSWLTRRTKGEDFYLAKNGDLKLATTGDFSMATDIVPIAAPSERPPQVRP
jgi:hypothetical protein